MEQHKVRTYIFYAVGEILLVVAGILIALQINNWNEQRVNRINESFYLDKLEKSLRSDSARLEGNILFIETIVNSLDSVEIMLINPSHYTDLELRRNLMALAMVDEFNPERSVFDNLNATGDIKLIRNQELVDGLYNYYYIQRENSSKHYARNEFTPYMMRFDEMRFSLIGRLFPNSLEDNNDYYFDGRSVQEFSNDPYFINAVRFKRMEFNIQRRRYRELLEFIGKTLADIEEQNGEG